MKHVFLVTLLGLFMFSGAMAASSGRPAMSNKIMSAPQRYTASVNQLNGVPSVKNTVTNSYVEPAVEPKVIETEDVVVINEDTREAERNACINNNIGFGNTFVWASRYSDTSNYANMVEDVKNPQNNVCFVRVELKSDDNSRISVSDIPAKYFMWGENIECGSWANKGEIEKRILDAKKGNRIGGIVAISVASAGLGVGAMELFGNKLIGGKVQGQKNLEGKKLYRSQLLTLKQKNPSQYEARVADLKKIKEVCDKNGGVLEGFDCTSSLLAEFAK